MNDQKKTAIYVGIAVALAGLAFVTAPGDVRDISFGGDVGEAFFPGLTDPNVPTALEVVEFDEKLASAKPFKVKLENGKWIIPSHSNYPADAKSRLAQTAGGLIGLRKDSVVSDDPESHSEFGVIDPLDTEVSSSGRGTRVKLFDKADNPVADLIVGKNVEGKTGFKYARIPGKKRVYAVKADDLDLSPRFADWIDQDLLELTTSDMEEITLDDYKIVVAGGRGKIDRSGGKIVLEKKDSKWVADGIAEGEQTADSKASDLASAIDNMKIVGVRAKPKGLDPNLRVSGQVEAMVRQQIEQSMQRRGFYVIGDGDILSDQGETLVETKDGLVYTLRFGGVLLGSGDAIGAGSADEQVVGKDKATEKKEGDETQDDDVQENRFLMVSVAFDESKFPAIPDPEPEATPEPAEAKEKPAEESSGAECGDDAAESKDDDEPKSEEKPAKDEPKESKPVAASEKAPAEKAPAEKTEPAKKADPNGEKAAPAKSEPVGPQVGPPVPEDAEKAKQEKEKEQADLKRKRDERQRKVDEGTKKATELSDRYAEWYYVISNDTFKKIHVGRSELVEEKKKDEGSPRPGAPQSPFGAGLGRNLPLPPPAKKAIDKKSDSPAKKADSPAKKKTSPKPAEKAKSADKPPAPEKSAPKKKQATEETTPQADKKPAKDADKPAAPKKKS